jgi:cytochrome c
MALWPLVAAGAPAADPAAAAKALVERAAAHIGAVGAKQAFQDFSRHDGGFVVGELYVFCVSSDGTMLAHGGNPRLVARYRGAAVNEAGIHPVNEAIRIAREAGSGWFDYDWPNPASGHVEHKITYVLRIDAATTCASGFYKPDRP